MILAMLVATAAASWSVDPLPSWRDGVAKQRIFDFVANVTQPGPNYVAPQDRVVLFDDDGTLWPDQSMPLSVSLTEDPIRDPVSGRRYADLVYVPMSEMLAFLRASGFTVYIVASGDVDTIRPWASLMFDVPPGHVVASGASIARPPIMAFVSTDADLLACTTAGAGPALGVVVDSTDASSAAQNVQLVDEAPAHGWLVVDVPRDWRRLSASPPWPEH